MDVVNAVLQKFSPLHKAAESKGPEYLEIANILLAANANLRQLNDAKQSALHLAALSGLLSVQLYCKCKILI